MTIWPSVICIALMCLDHKVWSVHVLQNVQIKKQYSADMVSFLLKVQEDRY